MMRSFVIVGSGNRVRNNFLPAISAMRGEAQAIALASRTHANAQRTGQSWGVPAANSVRDLPWQSADAVIVSVPPKALVATLGAIKQLRPGIDLVVDTPALPATSSWRQRIFEGFGRVAVAEDYMNFPPFELMRRYCSVHGQPTRLRLEGAGYSYHGLALIRSFFNFAPIDRLSVRHAGGERTISMRIGESSAEMVYPYDRERGTVSAQVGGREIVFGLSGEQETDTAQRLHVSQSDIDGCAEGAWFELGDMRLDHEFRPVLRSFDAAFDRSNFNIMKTCGLINVLRNVVGTDANINSQYDARNACYDAAIGRLTQLKPFGAENVACGILNRVFRLRENSSASGATQAVSAMR